MAYKIKVQDGIIVYTSTDPDNDVTFDIDGVLNVKSEINIVSDSPVSTISSAKDIVISSSNTGAVRVEPESGQVFLNGVSWPQLGQAPTPGMYIGASSSNTLEYQQFIIGTSLSDNATGPELNALYPDALPGQSVAGPSVLFTCVAANEWRALGFGDIVIGEVNSDLLSSAALEAIFPEAQAGQFVVGPTVMYIFVGTGWRSLGPPVLSPLQTIKTVAVDYTLISDDANNTMIVVDSAAVTTVFVPEDSAVDFPIGASVDVLRNGTANVPIVGEPGVTVNVSAAGGSVITNQYVRITLTKLAANTWLMSR